MNVDGKVKKGSKKKSKSKSKSLSVGATEQAVRDVGQQGAEALVVDILKGFQPKADFSPAEPECCLRFSHKDELCLLQLPPSWKAGGGEIRLPARDGDTGLCTDERGNEFHVTQPPETTAAQMYIWSPGQISYPKRVSSLFTMVNARNLKDFELAPANWLDGHDTEEEFATHGKRKRDPGEKRTAEIPIPTIAEDEQKIKKSKKKKKKKKEKEDRGTEETAWRD